MEARSDPVTREWLRVGLATVFATSAVMLVLVLSGALTPLDLLFPGARGQAPQVLEEDFGAELPDRFSYDGQEIYVIARHFPDLEAANDAGIAQFRIRRILHPIVASPLPSGDATALALVGANVVGVGLAAGALARLASRHRRDARVGYAAAAALAFPLVISTTEPLAFGLGLAGIALAERRRTGLAVVALSLASLGRETALVMAIAAGLAAASRRQWREALTLTGIPVLVFALWSWILSATVPSDDYVSSTFLGFLDLPALTAWDVIACGATLALMALGAWRWRDVPVVALTNLGFLGACLLYIGDQYQWHGLPRVSAAAVAIGLAAVPGARAEVQPSPASSTPR